MADADDRSAQRFQGRRSWRSDSFLGRLDPTRREALLRLGVRQEYPPGRVLVAQGDRTDHVILVHSGLIKVTVGTEEGHVVLLGVRMSGDAVGELAAVDGAPRSATLTVYERVIGQKIERERFRAFLCSNPDASLLVTSIVGERLRAANRRRLEFGGYSVKARVVRVLLELCRSLDQGDGRARRIRLPLTHQELAELTGSAVVSVQKVLRELRQQQLVDTGYRRVTVLNLERLTALEPQTRRARS
jgi:CRP-like cAMP-binding protein